MKPALPPGPTCADATSSNKSFHSRLTMALSRMVALMATFNSSTSIGTRPLRETPHILRHDNRLAARFRRKGVWLPLTTMVSAMSLLVVTFGLNSRADESVEETARTERILQGAHARYLAASNDINAALE